MFYSVPNNLVFMGTDHMSEANVKYLKRYNAKISSTNPEYTTINDIVYTKDMRKVVSCFCHKIDDVTIEDGVEEIGNGAFIDCQITSVKIPESENMLMALLQYTMQKIQLPNGGELFSRLYR